jgi:hypothetical protein
VRSDRTTVLNLQRAAAGDTTIESELAGDDSIGEVSFAHEYGHHEDLPVLDQIEGVVKLGFFLPEGGLNLSEATALSQVGCELMDRPRRVRI